MATSSPMSTSNSRIEYTITVTQNSQNVNNNTSNVTVSVRFYRTNTGYTSYGTGTVYCKINGTTYSASVTPSDKITHSGIVLFTKTLNISHSADGTKNLTCSAWIKHDVVTSSEQSYTQTLTTIPRASTITASASSVDIGNSVTFTITRASSSFTHKLTYKFGDASGTIGSDIGTSKAWTVPTSLATEIPNATSGTCAITCTTYNGSTSIGSKTLTLTLKVKSTVVPTVSFTVAEAVSNIADKFGVYVKNLSKMKITASGTGASGSTIKSYKITANGATYNSSSATTGLLQSSGSMKITVAVTDSRGRTGSADKTITVYDYSAPYIERFTVARCNADGTLNDEGSSVNVDFKAGVSDVNGKNTGEYVIQYKTPEDDEYTETSVGGNALEYETALLVIDNIDTEKTYEFRLVVSDALTAFIGTVPLSTAFTLVDYFEDGTGIAFGKVATEPGKADFNLQIIPRAGFKNILLSPETDLNNVVTPNSYYGENVATYNYVNCPISTGTFDLDVVSCGDDGQVKQRLTSCRKTDARTFERFYYSGAWGEWVCVSDYKGTLLWSDVYYMNEGQTATLSEPVHKQTTGIVLVFSLYDAENKEAKNQEIYEFFIPKYTIGAHSGSGHNFNLCGMFGNAVKYLYLYDDKITGYKDNSAETKTVGGITYTNRRFVLRYVIGV